MSQINLKSITGITSITTPAGVDNVFTVHSNDTTERFRVDSNGNQVIAGILTTTGQINANGNITATRLTVSSATPRIYLTDTNNNDDFQVRNENGTFEVRNDTDSHTPFSIASNNTVTVHNDLDVDGHTNLDNVSIAGVTTITGGTSPFQVEHTGGAGVRITRNSKYLDINANWGGSNTHSAINFGNSMGFALYSSNSEKVRITSDGTVGINSSIPGALLDLSSGQPGILFSETDVSANNGKWLNQANGSELYWQAQTDAHSGGGNLFKMTRSDQQIQSFEAQHSAVTWFTIRNSDRRVGIGTDNPGSTLQIVSDLNNIFQIRSTNRYSTMYMIDSIGSTFMQCDSGDIRLGTGGGANVSGGESERVRIKSDGKFGINVTSPDCMLHVAKASAGSMSADGNAVLALENSNHCVLNMMTPADKSSYIMMGDPDDRNAGQIRYDNNINALLIDVNSSEKLRIDSSGRVMIGGATSAHGSTNRDDLVIGAVNQSNQTGITIGSASASGISFADAGNDTAGGIYYSHGNDDMIFYAGGNARGRIYDNAGITGIEHHRFIPFLIGYDVQNTTNITMSKGFGGMSQLPMNADGDKAYMSYVTHWRHREYAGVYFWYGASGNTSGSTFDWDFTVWNASSGSGYSSSSHSFTVTSGTMSNGKMYRLNATSSWPTHAATKFVQFVIEYDELQNGTSLQLSGMELAEYTTP